MHFSKVTTMLMGACLFAATSAGAFTSENGLTVDGTADGFEVFPTAGTGGSEYFCAAGDFARRELGARSSDRVEIIKAYGPSPTRANQRSVGFRLSAYQDTSFLGSSAFLGPRRVGQSRSVGHSIFLCTDVNVRGN